MTEETTALLREIASYRDRDPEDARMLPPEVYLTDELFEFEMEHIFRREWILVGREEQARDPGDYFTTDLLEEPLLIARGADQQLRAFSNICRHRYMRVAEASGNARLFVCPYHKWSYDLEGKLRAAPGMEGNTTFDAKSCRLPEVRVEAWEGFVFVNLDDDAEPLRPKLQSFSDHFREFGIEKWKTIAWYDEVWEGNWKLTCENGLDSYHHMGLHWKTAEPFMPALGTRFAEAHAQWNYHRTPILPEKAREVGMGDDRFFEGLRPDQADALNSTFVYPNVVVGFVPGQSIWLSAIPIDRTHTRIISSYTVPTEFADDAEIRATAESYLRELNTEDAEATWRLQEVLASQRIERGPIGVRERGVYHFYQYLARMLPSPD